MNRAERSAEERLAEMRSAFDAAMSGLDEAFKKASSFAEEKQRCFGATQRAVAEISAAAEGTVLYNFFDAKSAETVFEEASLRKRIFPQDSLTLLSERYDGFRIPRNLTENVISAARSAAAARAALKEAEKAAEFMGKAAEDLTAGTVSVLRVFLFECSADQEARSSLLKCLASLSEIFGEKKRMRSGRDVFGEYSFSEKTEAPDPEKTEAAAKKAAELKNLPDMKFLKSRSDLAAACHSSLTYAESLWKRISGKNEVSKEESERVTSAHESKDSKKIVSEDNPSVSEDNPSVESPKRKRKSASERSSAPGAGRRKSRVAESAAAAANMSGALPFLTGWASGEQSKEIAAGSSAASEAAL